METISRTAKRFNLSRSTLLYYDRINLLRPAGRTPAGYRQYTAADIERLEKICFYRRTGASLAEIRRLLDASDSALRTILETRLTELNNKIHLLRHQQQVIVKILKHDRLPALIRGMNKDKWVALLRAVGLDEAAMHRWHVAFEQLSPEGHHDFLASIGMVAAQIWLIRQWAQAPPCDLDAGDTPASNDERTSSTSTHQTGQKERKLRKGQHQEGACNQSGQHG